MALSQQMTAWIRRKNLTNPGDGVLVGFSGGPDSLCLLLALAEQKAVLQLSFLCACHVHHGLRGAEADADEAFCAAFCAAHEIPYLCKRADVPGAMEQTGASLETAARLLRYEALEQAADDLEKAYGCPCKIATAHHAGDQAETVLFHLVRGTGLSGLCGIPVRRGRVIRPFLFARREEILADLQKKHQPYCLDKTNEEDDARRNVLRHHAIPVLEALNPRFCADLADHAEAWRADDALLQHLTDEAFAACRQGKGLNRKAFLRQPEALQNRVAAAFLQEAGAEPSLLRIAQLKQVASCARQRAQIGGGLTAQRSGPLLILSGEKIEKHPFSPVVCTAFPMRISPNGVFPEISIHLVSQVHKNIMESSKKPLFIGVDYDTIKGSPVLRNPLPDDRICPLGMNGHRSVTALLSEAGLCPPFEEALVLADDAGVLAVFSAVCRRCACRCVLTDKTERALLLEFAPAEQKNL